MPVPLQLPHPCYVVSDHHFGAVPASAENDFLSFLTGIKGDAGALIINGDLFDFWFEWRSVVPRVGFRVLAALAEFTRSGIPVLWIGGNHDCWGGDFLTNDVGAHFTLGVWHGDIAGWRTRIEHGDGLRPVADRRYRLLRSVIRHPLAIGGMKLLHPDVGTWLAVRSSGASRDHRARDGGAALKEVAADVLQASENAPPPQLYVLGHSHVPALEKMAHGGIYANAGSWSDGGTHLRILPNTIELRGFTASKGYNHLNSVHR